MGSNPRPLRLLLFPLLAIVAIPLFAGCASSDSQKPEAKIEARKQDKLKSDK